MKAILKNIYSGISTVFMLHRVDEINNNRLFPNENMKVSPSFLDELIFNLKKLNYDFISLDDLYFNLKNQNKIKKKIVFTLDDGYIDNYNNAFEIFKKNNIPFTIYLTTCFPEGDAFMWWYILEELILNNDTLIYEDISYNCKTITEKNKLFLDLRSKILEINPLVLKKKLLIKLKNYDINSININKSLCMKWDNIIELSESSLCTIGGHTSNHYNLNLLNKNNIVKEINDANNLIEKYINKKVDHFAYPFGTKNEANNNVLSIVKDLGFKTSTTTRKGNVYLKHINHLECIPRFMLTEDFKIDQLYSIRKKRIVTE
jgi:peptidoglycan/xylan/chitin deacetylase (PgdA/CDA1 family)